MPSQRDILIRVYGRPNDTYPYPVDATLDDDSYFPGGELRIPEEELLKLELELQPYGARLGQCLFTAPILRALEKAYAPVSSKSASQMRVRLCIDPNASDLHAYPWERLFVPWQGSAIPLAASSQVPFSRFIPLEEGQQDPIETRPIRLLLAVSNPLRLPTGLEHIDVEAQLKSLTDAISTVPGLKVTVLPGYTPVSGEYKQQLTALGYELLPGATTLPRLIDAAGQHHIVHLLCHGTFKDQTASLFLENEDGDTAKTADTDITTAIASLSAKPKLIYLSACDSANQTAAPPTTTVRPLVGLAPKLVQAGVPAVIAMQTQVEIETARTLAASFYAKVLEYGEVDRALSEARFAISKTTEWWIPVLFLRLKNGRLFTTDPVREALQGMQANLPSHSDRHYLPLEAVSLNSKELIRDWERTTLEQRTGADLWQLVQDFRPGLTVVAGNAGTGKSTLLYRLARATADAAALPQGTRKPVVPLIVDLRDYANARASGNSRARNLIFESFRALAPSLTETKFDKLLSGQEGVLLRFLFDNADQMPDKVRRPAIQEIQQMADGSPHEFLLTMDCRLFEPSDVIQELLVIQPVAPRKVVRFLSPVADTPHERSRGALLQAIQDADLFELAALPWLLLHMLEQVKRVLPRSRVMVLEDWVDTALYSAAPIDGGRSFRARESLYALGWKMHSERRQCLPMEDAFQVMRDVRSQREYDLEKLLTLLVESGMLVRVGEEIVRFAYPALQGYCTACALLNHPRRSVLIEEVVATLGQLNRVAWWGRVLSLLSGMLPDPAPVLQPLVYGASLTQGEQVFVAAECLIEHERGALRYSAPTPNPAPPPTTLATPPTTTTPTTLATPPTTTTPTTLATPPTTTTPTTLATPPATTTPTTLATPPTTTTPTTLTTPPTTTTPTTLATPPATPPTTLATPPTLVSRDRKGAAPALESFRQQIIAALLWRAKRANEFRYSYRERAAEALGLFRRKETIPTLISLAVDRVRDEDAAGAQFEYSQVRAAAIRSLMHMRDQISSDLLAGHPRAADLIAAWTPAEDHLVTLTALLKDNDEGIQGAAAFALGDLQTPESARALYAAFRDPSTRSSTLWAIADAIRALEPCEVVSDLILPCIEEAEKDPGAPVPATPLYERLIFLIGELRTHHPRARAFVSRYLSEPVDARFKGRALAALGKLHAIEEAATQQWEAVIHGDFRGIAAVGDSNVMFLRRKAIEAVGELGDVQTLYRARQTQDWVPELDEAFFRAAEKCLTFPGARPIQQVEPPTGDSENAERT
ncbi:MAG: CHAT domain-containing protein [Bryobacteraceae bacterium]